MSDGGYSLSDLKRIQEEMRAAWQETIREREMRLMEQMGPDVYFHVLGPDLIEGEA